MALYLCQLRIVCKIYQLVCKVNCTSSDCAQFPLTQRERLALPQWLLLALVCCSRRVHAIFVLGLFNDCVCTTLAHGCVLVAMLDHWATACFLLRCVG